MTLGSIMAPSNHSLKLVIVIHSGWLAMAAFQLVARIDLLANGGPLR
ncbi:hypothetical protein [Dictyobacter vulcani]|nr:hypothetical protein [Dictyobacter vulcani]